jgi:hypothetical protein
VVLKKLRAHGSNRVQSCVTSRPTDHFIFY